jgi:hypothetical protein
MNTFWLKIAALVIIIVAAIVLISVFSSSERPEPLQVPTAAEPVGKPAKNFYEQVDKDIEKFSSPPKSPEQPEKKPAEEPVKQQAQEQNQPAGNKPVHPAAKPVQLYFKPLSEIDKVEAERLLNVAVSGRSLGRLPQTGFQLMVQTCRQIIGKWPDSWYAYNAKRMLIDMPVRFRERYKITQEELDISEYERQRPGTEPFNGNTETGEE